jgi:Fe-S-cluster containining protein
MAHNNAAGEAEFKLNLKFGESRRAVTIKAPAKSLPRSELLPILQAFDNEVVTLAEEESARQGKRISCCAGCGACCRQFVPIAESEAHHLAAVVERMPSPRREEIKRRFADGLAAYEQAGIRDRLASADQLPDEASRGEFGLAVFRIGVACPFLESESCGIYPDRPLACREFLVTSPAVNCQNPGPDNIERVPLPAQLSEALYRFGSRGERQPARWMPLMLALEYAAEHRQEAGIREDGIAFVKGFLGQLGGGTK